ncbi:MAG TPA: hypothetical protein VLC93_04795 [Myxococcota bacterium]|nr:hypothetical protein [Myxococcota bacterium]
MRKLLVVVAASVQKARLGCDSASLPTVVKPPLPVQPTGSAGGMTESKFSDTSAACTSKAMVVTATTPMKAALMDQRTHIRPSAVASKQDGDLRVTRL